MELILSGVSLHRGGVPWLADVNLRLAAGMTILIGPGNAGKTTLMRVVAGLVQPDSGQLLVNGQDVTSISVRRRSVAFVYQQFVNYPSLSVYENIASPLRLAGDFAKGRIDHRVREVAGFMGIGHLLDRRPAELSGGQQQRTAIARALARPVDVLLLDEPLANLDYKLREQLRADLSGMFGDSGRIVLYSTADPAEALTFAAPTVVMGEGRVQHVGEAAEMFDHPPTLAVAQTLSDPPLNLLPGTAEDGSVRTPLGVLPIAADRPEVLVGIRPADLAEGGDGIRFTLLAGPDGTLRHPALTRAAADDPRLSSRLLTAADPAGRRTVAVTLDPDRALLFDPQTGAALRTGPPAAPD